MQINGIIVLEPLPEEWIHEQGLGPVNRLSIEADECGDGGRVALEVMCKTPVAVDPYESPVSLPATAPAVFNP